MWKSHSSIIAGPVLIFFSIFLNGVSSRAVQQPSMADRDISLTVVTASGAPVAVAFNVQELELTTTRTVFKQGDTVKQLLTTNSILPDTESYGLVYDLNPSLRSLTTISHGDGLVLPKVSRGESQPTLPDAELVALTVDTRLKNELTGKFDSLKNLITTINSFGVDRFSDAAERSSTLRFLKDINDSFTAIGNLIKGKVRPISNEVINQVKAETDLLLPTLEKLTQPGTKPSAEDLNIIKLVYDDLKVKRRTLTDVRGANEPPTRWREVVVVVRTVGSDGRQVPQLRIYYVPEALRGRPQFIKSFDTLSSPTQRSLPEANYIIWAGRPGQETEAAALSDVKRLPLRRSSEAPLPVDLAIIH